MTAPATRSAELLDRIASTLDLPVEAFNRPHPDDAALQFARMIADPAGRRLLAAFAAMPPHCRSGLANVAEVIVAASPQAAVDGQEAGR